MTTLIATCILMSHAKIAMTEDFVVKFGKPVRQYRCSYTGDKSGVHLVAKKWRYDLEIDGTRPLREFKLVANGTKR